MIKRLVHPTFNHSFFDYDYFINDANLKSLFKIYLDLDLRSPEMFDFIEDVEQCKLNKIPHDRIIRDYLHPDSPKRINTSKQMKEEAISTLNFAPIYDEIRSKLRLDVFVKFCESFMFMKYVVTSPHEVRKMLQKSLKNTIKLVMTVDTFYQPSITEEDVSAIKVICSGGMYAWKDFSINPEASFGTFRMRDKVELKLNDNKTVSMLDPQPFYRAYGTLEYKLERVLNMLINRDYRHYWDENISSASQIAYLSNQSIDVYPSTITHEVCTLPWPISNRDFVVSSTLFRCPNQLSETFYMIRKSTEYYKESTTKNIRGFTIEAFILSKIDDFTTKYINIFYRNLREVKESSPTVGISQRLNKKRMKNLHQGIMTAMKQFTSGSVQNTDRTNGLYQTMQQRQNNKPVKMRTIINNQPVGMYSLKSFWEESEKFENPLKRLIFVSKCSRSMSSDHITTLGQLCAKKNKSLNVSGVLVLAQDIFYSVLEGAPSDVDTLMAIVQKDVRHFNVKIIANESDIKESERIFTYWSMKVVDESEQYFIRHLLTISQTVGDYGTISEESTIMEMIKQSDDKPSTPSFKPLVQIRGS
ncbi:hypothetical protein AKO1_009658 [Acrasis kona]|uniref:BLUF domain-containing protein n=1 Tax=Acrasis kona TaxID=1008807 RepID=A0AAW2ZN86_9EUKA